MVVWLRNALHRDQCLDTWSPVARVVSRGFCAASLKKEYVIGEDMKLYRHAILSLWIPSRLILFDRTRTPARSP